MEKEKLKYEKNEAGSRFNLHILDSKVHALRATSPSQSKTGPQHRAKCGNCYTEKSKSHAKCCSAEITKLNPPRNFSAHFNTYPAVAKSGQQSTLTCHCLKCSGPVV